MFSMLLRTLPDIAKHTAFCYHSIQRTKVNNITFVEATTTEAEVIASLAREIWPVVYSDIISDDQINYMLDWMYSLETIQNEIAHKSITYLLIQDKTENIGFLAFEPEPRKVSFIHKLYLSPRYHRRGIGTAALLEIERRSLTKGAKHLELRVNRQNQRAIALYQRCGFTITAEDCADIGIGFEMDDYIFQKNIG